MPGCGYVCPKCNDSGLDEEGQACTWCAPDPKALKVVLPSEEISDEEWIKRVHEGPCCGDLGQSANPDPNCTVT